MRTDTVAVRDRILAALREADRPLTTAEVCEAAGPYLEVREHREWTHRSDYAGCWQLVSCDGTTEVISLHLAAGQRGWRELARFERLGMVTAVREPGARSVLWWGAGTLVERELDARVIADLELMLSQDGAR